MIPKDINSTKQVDYYKMGKILLSFCFVFIFCLAFTQAETYKQGEQINLQVPFVVNGSIPSSSAICNLNIQYPNSSLLLSNVSMNNQNTGMFNYTFNSSVIGNDYKWIAYCCDGTQCSSGYDYFNITRDGTLTYFLTSMWAFLIILLFALVFLFLSYIYDKKLFIFSSISFIGAGVFILYFNANILNEIMTDLIGILLIGIGFLYMGTEVIPEALPE